jgi:hypothetical protein
MQNPTGAQALRDFQVKHSTVYYFFRMVYKVKENESTCLLLMPHTKIITNTVKVVPL